MEVVVTGTLMFLRQIIIGSQSHSI